MTKRLAIGLGVFLLAATPAGALGLSFDASTVDGPRSGMRAELSLPVGGTAMAAMIVLHGCGGIVPHDRQWAARLAEWGYAALLVDSFRPRGFTKVCNRGLLVPPEVQSRDAFDAASHLRSRPDLDVRHIGVIGFSHGGWAVLKAALTGAVRRPDELPFDAAIAFYPGCDPPRSALETDALILIGDADYWTPVTRYLRWSEVAQSNGHALRIKVYQGALHAFDALVMPRILAGHFIGCDPAAADDAIAETRGFLATRLVPP